MAPVFKHAAALHTLIPMCLLLLYSCALWVTLRYFFALLRLPGGSLPVAALLSAHMDAPAHLRLGDGLSVALAVDTAWSAGVRTPFLTTVTGVLVHDGAPDSATVVYAAAEGDSVTLVLPPTAATSTLRLSGHVLTADGAVTPIAVTGVTAVTAAA